MKKYKDLDLKIIREKADLDFAHYTYKPGMCSCCYSPTDLPKIYWRNKEYPKVRAWDSTDKNGYQYLLFKNADNGSGHVEREDTIDDYTCIEWGFPEEKLDTVCKLLEEQLDDDYVVEKPENSMRCIVIRLKSKVSK